MQRRPGGRAGDWDTSTSSVVAGDVLREHGDFGRKQVITDK